MSELVPASRSNLAALTTDELLAKLSEGLGGWARQLLHLSHIWVELVSRGEKLDHLRTGIGVYLPAIATGSVLPDIVVRFSGQPNLLRSIATLPPSEQQVILDTGRVPVAMSVNGEYTTRMLPVHGLSRAQVDQVFGDRKIRSEAEQIASMSPAPWRPNRHKVTRGKVVADRKAGTIRIGSVSAPAEDVIEALKAAGMIPQ